MPTKRGGFDLPEQSTSYYQRQPKPHCSIVLVKHVQLKQWAGALNVYLTSFGRRGSRGTVAMSSPSEDLSDLDVNSQASILDANADRQPLHDTQELGLNRHLLNVVFIEGCRTASQNDEKAVHSAHSQLCTPGYDGWLLCFIGPTPVEKLQERASS